MKFLAIVCAIAVASAGITTSAQGPTPAQPTSEQAVIPADQLDSLVAPIALYPDPLLAQTLAASTYPLELIQLRQWLDRNPTLKDKALADAVAKQPWDPSIQAMAALPDLVKRLADDIQWTTDLGNAFLAQQPDVMNAIQRMRAKAQDKGTLKSTEQQVVKTEVVQDKTVVVIEQADPQTIYVPSYDPHIVYGDPFYPYPPIYYPPAGYYAAGAAISFGVGMAIGAAWGGGWGWGAGWGNNEININNNNNFNRAANVNGGNRGNWQHNAQHRGGAPYGNRATADRFGGTTRGDSLANRQSGARQQVGRDNGNLRSNGVGTSGRGDLGNRGGVGDRGGLGDRGGVGNRGNTNLGGGNFSGFKPGGGGDRVGSRDLSSRGGRNDSAFGGGRMNGDAARANRDRGSSSFGGSRGGGSRGGGGFSGGGGGARRGGGGGGRRR